MRRPLFSRFRVLLFSLFLLVCGSAGAAGAAEHGALFLATLDGHSMVLFGTLHVGAPGFYPLEPRIVDALGQATTLALELDPAQPQRELERAVREHGMLEPGAAGYDSMAPARKALLDRLIAQSGYDPARVGNFKPVLLATLLTMAEYTRQGYRSELSSDAWLARQARENDIKVVALESMDRQLSLLDRLPVPDRWRFLDEMMDTIDSGAQRKEARAMVQAWSTADRAALDAIAGRCNADASVSGKFVNQVLLKERNAGLADGLLNLLRQEKKTFAAIGVLHLLGQGSVPALLRERGVRVERIY